MAITTTTIGLDSSHDPIITFGRYKGKKLSELPGDYLNWMATGKKLHGLIVGGRNWEQLAKEELDRRHFYRLPTDGTSYISKEEASDYLHQDVTKNANNVFVTLLAIDDASRLLLKEFILRSDKGQGLLAWMKEVSREAIKAGKREEVFSLAEPKVDFIYLGRRFHFLTDQNGVTHLDRISKK